MMLALAAELPVAAWVPFPKGDWMALIRMDPAHN